MRSLDAMIEEVLEPALRLAGAQIRDVIRGYEGVAEGLRDELALANREIERLQERTRTLDMQLRRALNPDALLPKRRGRPPKEMVEIPTLKHKRGRPPKIAVSPQGTLKGQPKRGPGRPRKQLPEDMQVRPEVPQAVQPGKRPRGRPRKVIPALPPTDIAHTRGRNQESQQRLEAEQAPTPAHDTSYEH